MQPKFIGTDSYRCGMNAGNNEGVARAMAEAPGRSGGPAEVHAAAVSRGHRAGPPRLLDQMRDALRVRHYAIRTERAYVDWVRRYVRFHDLRHPTELGAEAVTAFLTHLAVERKVSPSTQNQAKAALLFFYGQVLKLELPWLTELIQAQVRRRLPVVLTPPEVRALLGELHGTSWLIASLLYGTGMRLLEGLRLRVKDVEFSRRELAVREGKGGKDRVHSAARASDGPVASPAQARAGPACRGPCSGLRLRASAPCLGTQVPGGGAGASLAVDVSRRAAVH